MKRRVTLKDVAEAACVTVPTVSAALNGTGRISDGRRRQIAAIARRLNYQPNVAAQLLKSKTCTDVGLVINERADIVTGSGMFQTLMTSFVRYCELNDVRGRTEFIDAGVETDRVPQLLAGGLVGGVLLTGVVAPWIWEWLRDHADIPYVIVEESGDYSVNTDMTVGVEQAVQYLAALGHQRLAITYGPVRFPPHHQARDGFLRACGRFGIAVREDWMHEFEAVDHPATIRGGLAWGHWLFSRPDRPTAVLCNGMPYARSVICAALESGLRVPADVSIVGAGADWEAEKSCPLLTAIEWDPETTVREAMTLLSRRMQERRIPQQRIITHPKFTVRDTTASAPVTV